MEHLVQFTFSVDDDAIQRRLEEAAYKDVVKELLREVKAAIPTRRHYKHEEIDWHKFASNEAQLFFEEHKAEIIDAAAKYMAERLAKTKAAREAMEKASTTGVGE